MALSLLAAYGSSSEEDSDDDNNVQPNQTTVSGKVSLRPQPVAVAAIQSTVPQQKATANPNTTSVNASQPVAATKAVIAKPVVVKKTIKKNKKASASARQLPMLRALPTFEDLEEEEDDDDAGADQTKRNWLATSTTTQDNKTSTEAKKRKVGDSKHRTLLSKLPAPKHALHAPPEKQTHMPMRTSTAPEPVLSHSATVNLNNDDDDDDDDEQEPASLKLIESLVGAVPMDTADNTSSVGVPGHISDTPNEKEEEENEEDGGMVGPMRPTDSTALHSYAYDDVEDMPAPYIPEEQRNRTSNRNGSSFSSSSSSSYTSTAASGAPPSSSGMSWNERIATKKKVRRAEAELYNLNSGVNGNRGCSSATGQALAVLGAQGGTVVSLSDSDFKQDAQRYRDSLPQDEKGEEGPTLQMKRWNTQTGEVTSSTRVGITSNRKNQISALASQSRGREKELQEQWGKVKTGNADNRKKYGF